MEAPSSLNAVEPLLPATSSRPGPAFELKGGVFRTSRSGKYSSIRNRSFPHPPLSSSTSSPSNLPQSLNWTPMPGRTLASSSMEAPSPLNAVELLLPATSSRPGPAFELGGGVFRTSRSGKYSSIRNSSFPDPLLRSRAISSPNQLQSTLSSMTITGSPGRANHGITEAPYPSNSVEPLSQRHHSRPGPAVETGEGVFHRASLGKYPYVNSSSCSDLLSDRSIGLLSSVDHLGTAATSGFAAANSSSVTPSSTTSCGSPGRTNHSITEAPYPSNAVEPSSQRQHSRPGPVVEIGEGVFHHVSQGEYVCSNLLAHPDLPTNSRSPSVAFRKQDVLIFYQNAGGMNSNIEEYRLAVSDCSYDIIVLCETWLDSRTISSQVFGTDYEVFRCDRNHKNSRKSTGGGVLIAVRSSLKARAIENDSWSNVEQTWTAINLGDRTLFLCALYIPPDRVRDAELLEAHCRSLFTVLESASPVDELIVLGDFNLPGISWTPAHSGFLYPDSVSSTFHAGAITLLDSYSAATLSQINYVANERNRCLDLCFASTQEKAPLISAAPCPLVKVVPLHPPLVVTVEYKIVRDFDEFPAAVSYDFRKADHRSIAEVLSSIDWGNILDPDDVEVAAQTFSHILSYVIDRHVPKITHRKDSHPPWQTTELRRLKSVKRAALRRFTKYRTLPLKLHYVRLNHVYHRISRQCFSRFQRGIQRKLKLNPKSFWKYVNEQRKESGLPSSMDFNGEVAATPQDICRLFSYKFSSVFSNEPLNDDHITLAANNVPAYDQTLGNVEVNAEAIAKAARQLKSSLNPGPDGVPSAFLKNHLAPLLTPLTSLYRMSLSSGIFPSCWKFAHMFPVHKKGSKRDVNNYRGITSLSAISKLFELVVMEPLLSHCKQYLSADQHGFISGRSTTTNLLCLTSYVTDGMAQRSQTDVIYTDLSAAFDKINHAITIAKLGKLGVCGNLLQWFQSFLIDRQLTVAVGDCRSDMFPATSGIPQGSHLGPLIFLLYFNDVNLVIEGPRLSFADDLKLYLRIHSTDDCYLLQTQFDAFANWCSLNRMIVNPEKCSVITFTRIKDPIMFNYQLLGTTIERVSEVKDLGVILDSQLMFKQHISYIVDKASRTLGFIFRITKNFSDIHCLRSLYCSLVRSVLEYCSPVWNPNYNNGAERVESVQRRFLRFALRKLPWRNPFRLPSYESRCQLIELDPLRIRRDTTRALFIADNLQGRIDCPTLLEQINLNVQPRALRNNAMLRLPFRRTNYSMNGAMIGLQRVFNQVSSLFDFQISRQTLRSKFASFFLRTTNR